MYVGLEQANFWRREGFLPEFNQTCPKSFVGLSLQNFSTKIMKTFFWYDIQKKVFMCFSENVGCHFLKSSNIGRDFCPNFQRFCSDFRQIKTFGGVLPPPLPIPPDAQ